MFRVRCAGLCGETHSHQAARSQLGLWNVFVCIHADVIVFFICAVKAGRDIVYLLKYRP